MTITAQNGGRHQQEETSIINWMSVVVMAVVVGGFGPGYARAIAPPGLPWWVHLHGAVMSAWIVLFMVQGRLARHRSIALHRRLGAASLALVVAMTALTATTSALALRRGDVPPFFTPAEMLSADILDMAGFLGFYLASLAMRRRADCHKRLMLTAAVFLTWPALMRLAAHEHVALGDIVPTSVAGLLALTLIGPAVHFARYRSLHRADLLSFGVIGLLHPLYANLGHSAWLESLALRLTT